MSAVALVRPELRDLQPYEAAAQVTNTVRLNANEAPWTSSTDRFRRPLNRYPEVRPQGLRQALAQRYGCEVDNLLVTRGTSEAIDLAVRVFCRPGQDNIVAAGPTFSMYRHYAAIQDAQYREVPLDPATDFRPDGESLLAACDEKTRIVFVCSPNNPTGTLFPRETLEQLLQALAGRSVVIVDEAYVEFSGEASAVELLQKHENLLVLRTLSKALACAGARCGSVIGAAPIIRVINAVQAPYALATPVVECIEDALAAQALQEAEQWVATIKSERERVVAALQGCRRVEHVWPSAANFILVRVANVGELLRLSEASGILLRYFGRALADCVRISIGTPAENDRLLALFSELEETGNAH